MSDGITAALAFTFAFAVAAIATPVAIDVAWRVGFLDTPVGHKRHDRATPYLGGAAVVLAALPVAILLGGVDAAAAWILGGAVVMAVVGTIDDRRMLGPLVRLAVEVSLGVLLWAVGFGWSAFNSDIASLALSVVWVVGLVNAFNLMDNLDGAAGSVGLVCAAATGGVALVYGSVAAGVPRVRVERRPRRLPPLQPAPALARLPRRRWEHAGRVRDRGGADGGVPRRRRPRRRSRGGGGADRGLAHPRHDAGDGVPRPPWRAAPLRRTGPSDASPVEPARHARRVALALALAQAALCAIGLGLLGASEAVVITVGFVYIALGALAIMVLDLSPSLRPAVLTRAERAAARAALRKPARQESAP